jgi:hypothetical protein
MKPAGYSSVAGWIALCAMLCAMAAVEILLAARFRSDASRLDFSTKSIETKINGMGPIAADTGKLRKCEASFADDSEAGDSGAGLDDPLLSAKLQMDISRALAADGMDEKTARDRADEVSRSKAMIEVVGKISSSKQFVIRRVENRAKDGGADDWRIAVSCEIPSLPTLLVTLGYPPSGLKLCELRLGREKNGSIVAQSRFEARGAGGVK